MSALQVERSGDLTRITIDRPNKANALDTVLVEAMLNAVENAAANGTRLLTFHGNGNNFSTGFDFSDFEECTRADLLWRFVRIEQLLQAVYHAPFATAAFAHGKNFGAGADLFMACETRVATASATFRMPGLQFGIQLGTRRLAARIGTARARTVLAATLTVAGVECQETGFITHLVEQSEWTSTEQQLLTTACTLEPAAAVRLLRATLQDTRAEDLADLVTSATHGDLKERIRRYRLGG